jgi:5'-3' exonuclease
MTEEIEEDFTDDFSNPDIFKSGRTLHIDGDILIYKPCCIFNDDSDWDKKEITSLIQKQINQMLAESNCDDYRIFLTTSTNFRDHLVDDYKANRQDVERPVNLKWVKKWAVGNLNAVWHTGLEADDLLSIYHDDNTVIWSTDKDLRQNPGKHLDEETRKVIEVTKLGKLQQKGNKIYFDGGCGFYFQMLTGDRADHIVGCGKRVDTVFKSGPNKGKPRNVRKGIGEKKAADIIVKAVLNAGNVSDEEKLYACRTAVAHEYEKLHGSNWMKELETQANLLFMVREQHGNVIKQWTYDDRDQYFDITSGVVVNDFRAEG